VNANLMRELRNTKMSLITIELPPITQPPPPTQTAHTCTHHTSIIRAEISTKAMEYNSKYATTEIVTALKISAKAEGVDEIDTKIAKQLQNKRRNDPLQ
jgi:hypothetical protein